MSEQPGAPAAGGQGDNGASAAATLAAGTTPPTQPNTAPPTDAPPSFWAGFKNDDLRGYMAKKQFADPEILAESYRNLEKFHGVPQDRLLKLPENMEDGEALKPIYEKLGLAPPATAEDYKFTDIQGADPEFAKTAQGWMHELGVPEKFARPLAEKWTQFAQAQAAAQLNEAAEEVATEMQGLKSEWGNNYDNNLEVARRAVRNFGFNQQELEAIEQVVGAAGLYKRFHTIGKRLGEAEFVQSDTSPKGFASPEAARSEIATLLKDAEFAKRIRSGDASAKEKWDRLHRMAYPEGN